MSGSDLHTMPLSMPVNAGGAAVWMGGKAFVGAILVQPRGT
jgi:hypothetical protein